jgi:hypothetical protein
MSASRLNNDYRAFAVPYLEVGWVCAPNAAGQSITANTITTLTLDTVVQDTSSLGVTVGSNQIQNLPAGTYYFEAEVTVDANTTSYATGCLGLYNVSDSSYIRRTEKCFGRGNAPSSLSYDFGGQFKIESSKNLDLRIICANNSIVHCSTNSNAATSVMTVSTAGADQRTTIKLWKVA